MLFRSLDLDRELTTDQRMIRDVVAQFGREHIASNLREWFEKESLPARELARELGSLGLLGMHLEGYDCAGTDATSYGLACLELEALDSGIRSLVSVQGSLAMYAIHAFGTEAQKSEWLPAMARGEKIGCFGLTEADFGSNPSGMRTAARQDGSDWILNGTKFWITNATLADVAVIWAQTDAGIHGFLVPTDTPGFSARLIEHKLSLRASHTAELVLDNVRLPASAILPDAKGLRAALSCLNEARFGIVFGVVGAARNCLETALTYSQTRVQFDRPIAGFQLTQAKLADMSTKLQTAYLLAMHIGKLKDAEAVKPEHISVGKFNNAKAEIGRAHV